MLPLARGYRVPLDDLVGAPEIGTQAGHGHRNAELATRHLAEVLGEAEVLGQRAASS